MKNVGAAQQTPFESYQTTFRPLLYGVALGFVMKVTGRAVRLPVARAAESA